MAQKVFVEMLDDLDGSTATHTVLFTLDGFSYEIDLSDEHAAALRDGLARFIAVARKTGGRRIRVATGQSTAPAAADRERARAIRVWALANGREISERGRISADITRAYDEAQHQQPPARKRAPRKKATAAN